MFIFTKTKVWKENPLAKKYADLSEVVTWLAMTNKNVILNNNGTLQKTYSFYGSDCSAMTDDDFSMYF